MKTMPPRSTSAKSFFKVILSSTLDNGKLRIPSKFVKYHGDDLDECVTLSVPTGRSWNVRIQRETDRSIWFHDGLAKFMEDNSIGIEFFVVFQYRGGSQFDVLIFDLTATEILYNCTNASATSDDNQMQGADIGEGDDDSIDCLGSSADLLSNRRSTKPTKSPSTHNRGKCFVRETDDIKQCCLTRKRKKMLNGGMPVDGSGGNISSKFKVENKSVGTPTSQRECTDKRTIEAENLSFSTTFKVTLKSYHIMKDILVVPREFAKLNNMPLSSQDIKLIDSDDNEWVVRFYCTDDNHYLAGGWRAFVKNKKLMAGDVCIFERIRGNQVKLKVNYRSAENNSKMQNTTRFVGCDASPSEFTLPRTVKAESRFLDDFFEVTLTPSYLSSYLNVPPDFAPLLAPFNSTIPVKVVDADNKEWVVRFVHKHRTHRLTKGWRQVVLDKKLKLGDICTFDRVRGNEVKLKVTTTILVE